jgi:thioredoxin-related protein
MKKIILAGLLWAGLHATLFAQDSTEVFEKVSSIAEALTLAKKENKLLFIDCYFQGCSPCAKMDKEVYPNSTVVPALEKDFVSVKVDVFKDQWGKSLPVQYALHGFPALLVLDKEGRLISRESGYKDPGQFLQLLAESKTKVRKQHLLTGFGTLGTPDLPAYYKEGAAERKVDGVEAAKFIHDQKDWLEDKAGFAILTSQKLAKEVEDFLLKNYGAYVAKYGQELVSERIQSILVYRMQNAVGRKRDEQGFQQFLQQYKGYFPDQVWKGYLQVLASGYYIDVVKDTTAYLQFMTMHPVIYHYYFNSFFAMMCLQKNDSQENCKLMAKWAAAVVNVETSLEIIQATADVHKRAGDMEGYRKYINLCLEKIAKYKLNNKNYYEKLLAAK